MKKQYEIEASPRILLYSVGADEESLDEIGAGMEEEGVPFDVADDTGQTVLSRPPEGSAAVLAYWAMEQSTLRVGVGVRENLAAMTMRGVPEGTTVFEADANDRAAMRRLGQNAARAVKGAVFICPS